MTRTTDTRASRRTRQPPSSGRVLLRRNGGIATVTLSHAGRLNAMSAAMWRQLAERFKALSADATLRCVIVKGEGGNFCAGADITEFMTRHIRAGRAYQYHQHVIVPALQAIDHCTHPTIALIRGVCIGGGFEIACSCDLRIAGDSARLGMPLNRLGFPAPPAELKRLLAVAGRAVALELLLEGRILGAAEAHEKRLITRLVKDDETEREASACAGRIAAGAPTAARLNKQFVRRLTPEPPPLDDSELRAFFGAWADSSDHREGVRAFLEKRSPEFLGDDPGANGT